MTHSEENVLMLLAWDDTEGNPLLLSQLLQCEQRCEAWLNSIILAAYEKNSKKKTKKKCSFHKAFLFKYWDFSLKLHTYKYS